MNITERFKNQKVSQHIHLKNKSDDKPTPRICNCFRLKSNRSKFVSLRKSENAEKAHFGDLQTCGSVWVCPVCGSMISERRSQELQSLIDEWKSKDPENCVIMITWTTPHYLCDSLSDVLLLQDSAMRKLKNYRQKNGGYFRYRTIIDLFESIGSYTGREITFGLQNGWHPHRHEVYFCKKQDDKTLIAARENLAYAWSVAFKNAGGHIKNLSHFLERSVCIDQVTDDDGYRRISNYVTSVSGENWTLAKEATKGIAKLGKNGNITPFGMLDYIRQAPKDDALISLFESKFYEYAETMKGKRQFFASKGLLQQFNTEIKTDAEIMQESDAGNHYAFITDEEWSLVLKFNVRGEVLQLTENRNEFEFLREFSKFLKFLRSKDG